MLPSSMLSQIGKVRVRGSTIRGASHPLLTAGIMIPAVPTRLCSSSSSYATRSQPTDYCVAGESACMQHTMERIRVVRKTVEVVRVVIELASERGSGFSFASKSLEFE